jgi:rubrerythrin
MKQQQLNELLLQSLETEKGGVQIYQTALQCVVNEELKEEWEKYLDQTQHHMEVMQELFEKLDLDPEQTTPGRQVVKHIGESLVGAMKLALASGGPPEAAELVACECVTLAETKDHSNWELLGQCAEKSKGEIGKALMEACEEVEDQEDEHIYHSKGWCRELWIASLGMPAVLPPPEEEKDVKTAIGAARAQQSRKEMLKK